MADLKDFVSRVPEYSGWNHAEKIKFFAWFLHTLEAKPYVNGADIAVCYSTLHDEQPSSIAPFLSNMEKKTPKEAIKESRGYSLVKKVRDELDATYLKRRTTVMVEKLLADLPGKIPDHAERVFLEEALTCFRNSAFRAAIVMTWNLTYFHMCQHVIAHKLAEFNASTRSNFPASTGRPRLRQLRSTRTSLLISKSRTSSRFAEQRTSSIKNKRRCWIARSIAATQRPIRTSL